MRSFIINLFIISAAFLYVSTLGAAIHRRGVHNPNIKNHNFQNTANEHYVTMNYHKPLMVFDSGEYKLVFEDGVVFADIPHPTYDWEVNKNQEYYNGGYKTEKNLQKQQPQNLQNLQQLY